MTFSRLSRTASSYRTRNFSPPSHFINLLRPNTISKPPEKGANVYAVGSALDLVIKAAKGLGCVITNMGPDDLRAGMKVGQRSVTCRKRTLFLVCCGSWSDWISYDKSKDSSPVARLTYNSLANKLLKIWYHPSLTTDPRRGSSALDELSYRTGRLQPPSEKLW